MNTMLLLALDEYQRGGAANQAAAQAFRAASRSHPDAADAWMGRLACGDSDPEVSYGLYRCRHRVGHSPLSVRFPTGRYIDCPIQRPDDAAAAYAASLIAAADYAEAAQILAACGDSAVPRYMRAVLAHTTARWPDVITALAPTDDQYLAAAGAALRAAAHAYLGNTHSALADADIACGGPLPSAATDGYFIAGLVHRARGDDDAAAAALRRAYQLDPEHPEVGAALNDTSLRLVTTSAQRIGTRTDPYDPATETDTGPSPAIAPPADLLARAREQLAAQIGLREVKAQVERLAATAQLDALRAARGLSTTPRNLHLAFTGPPGTGKTTVAEIVAATYHALGLLPSGTVVTASRRDLVGEYLGATAVKTDALIDRALGGVLFIDEAYTLIQTGLAGGDAFGHEALDVLLARMENDRHRLAVIIAGYDADIDRLLAANAGLASRFARRLRFASYTPAELSEIAAVIAGQRQTVLAPGAATWLEQRCAALPDGRIDTLGNARFVRTLLEAAEEERSVRLIGTSAELSEHDLITVTAADLDAAWRSLSP